MASIVAVADPTTGTVQLTINYPAPSNTPVHVVRVHVDGSEHAVIGSPVVMSNGWAVLYDGAAPMDTPVFYYAYTESGVIVFDDYSRVNVDTWNNATSGQAWNNTGGAAADYDVNGTQGTQAAPTAAVLRFSTLDTGQTDMVVYAEYGLNSATTTVAPITTRLWGRLTDTLNHYELQTVRAVSPSNAVSLAITKRVAGASTTIAGPITVYPSGHPGGTRYAIKFQVMGPELGAKIWVLGLETEPANWMLTAYDTDLTAGTLAGVGNRRETGNTDAGLVWAWDNFLLTTPNAVPPNSTVRYTFDTTDQGWVGEGSTTVAWAATPNYQPPGALQATLAMGAGFSALRFNDNDQLPNNLLPWGNTFTAWVLVPEDAPGTGWAGHLEVQDSTFAWHAATDVPLTPGVWTPLAYVVPYAVLINARSIGVQISATGVNATQEVYLDSVVQTFNPVSSYVELDTSPDGWLRHPTLPTLNIRMDNCEVHSPNCLDGDQEIFFKAFDAEEYASASGVFDIVMAPRPDVVGQIRKDLRTTLVLVSRQLSDITALKAILSPGMPLILSLPVIYGWGIETFGTDWIQVGDAAASRLGTDMRKPYRIWSLPLVVVDEDTAYPTGSVGGNGIGVAGATWGDLAVAGQTWGDHAATGNTWLDTAQGDNY